MVVDDAGPPPPTGLPLLGSYAHTLDAVETIVIATNADGLSTPRDLELDPSDPTSLWIVNRNTSVSIVRDVGLPSQVVELQAGSGSDHFLARPAALAFGTPGVFATAPEEDEVTQPDTPVDFMGPSLWTTDASVFDAGHASHIDMLHNSPNSVGIAWEQGNVYWVFDGAHAALTRYDFRLDHGPGGEDHSDGIVNRYVEGQVAYAPRVPSHMEYDAGLLYVADTGNNRVAILDPSTGTAGTRISPNYDGNIQIAMTGGTLTTLVDGASVAQMQRPSGLALDGDVVYVTDNETSVLFGFDRATGELLDWLDLSPQVAPGGLMGIAFDEVGRLFLVDALTDRVLRLAPAPVP
jgi:DNA-binding beta-propeller fold protein YncE